MITEAEILTYRQTLTDVHCWVVKIGSAMLTSGGQGLDADVLAHWAGQMAALQNAGKQVLLVSSGAIAVGMQQLGWHERPAELSKLQTAAAVGQMQLSYAWQRAFAEHHINVAQVLLTHDDAADRQRYLNIRSTLQTMCKLTIVPVINENDTVSYDEIRFGDNDNLGALVANVSGAGGYIILTDQVGMFDKNPREHKTATLLSGAYASDRELFAMAGKKGGQFGSGGMYTKVMAAQKAARSGTHTVLAYGQETNVITRITQGENIGTLFIADHSPQQARKQWLGSQLQIAGRLWLDRGAAKALSHDRKSLLAIGVQRFDGQFARGELLACINPDGEEVARGLSNYSSEEVRHIIGKHSHEVSEHLIHGDALIHRDNLVLS